MARRGGGGGGGGGTLCAGGRSDTISECTRKGTPASRITGIAAATSFSSEWGKSLMPARRQAAPPWSIAFQK